MKVIVLGLFASSSHARRVQPSSESSRRGSRSDEQAESPAIGLPLDYLPVSPESSFLLPVAGRSALERFGSFRPRGGRPSLSDSDMAIDGVMRHSEKPSRRKEGEKKENSEVVVEGNATSEQTGKAATSAALAAAKAAVEEVARAEDPAKDEVTADAGAARLADDAKATATADGQTSHWSDAALAKVEAMAEAAEKAKAEAEQKGHWADAAAARLAEEKARGEYAERPEGETENEAENERDGGSAGHWADVGEYAERPEGEAENERDGGSPGHWADAATERLHDWRLREALAAEAAASQPLAGDGLGYYSAYDDVPTNEIDAAKRARRSEKTELERDAAKIATSRGPEEKAQMEHFAQLVGGEKEPESESELVKAEHALRIKRTDMLLDLVVSKWDALALVNKVTAVHQLAAMNKDDMTAQTRLLLDNRFERLLVAVAERSDELSARDISNLMWACGSLHHWPAWMFKPFLFAVNAALDTGTFKAYQIPRIVYAFSQLETKPIRLLQRLEEHLVNLLDEFDMVSCAKFLTGYKKLQHLPHTDIMRKMGEVIVKQPEMINYSTPIEAAAILDAVPSVVQPGDMDAFLLALADRINEIMKELEIMSQEEGDGMAPTRSVVRPNVQQFSDYNFIAFIVGYTKMELADRLPDGLVDKWIARLRFAQQIQGNFFSCEHEDSLEEALKELGRDSAWLKSSIMVNLWYRAFREETMLEQEEQLKMTARQQFLLRYSEAALDYEADQEDTAQVVNNDGRDQEQETFRHERLLRWRIHGDFYNAKELYEGYIDIASPEHGYVDRESLRVAMEENNLPSYDDTLEGMLSLAGGHRGYVDYHGLRRVLHEFASAELGATATEFVSASSQRDRMEAVYDEDDEYDEEYEYDFA